MLYHLVNTFLEKINKPIQNLLHTTTGRSHILALGTSCLRKCCGMYICTERVSQTIEFSTNH